MRMACPEYPEINFCAPHAICGDCAGDTVTVTVAEPDLVGSWVEVAVRVAVPEEAGVKTPELLTLPIPEGLTDQLTALLKLPAPLTVGVQEEVWVVRIEPGEQDTATVVMAGDTVTVTVAEPDLVGSWVEVAVRVAVPEEAGVKTPELLTLPIPEGLTDQLTALLKLPAPLTVGVQEEVWVVRIEPGEQDTATVVMAGDTVTVTVAEPDLVGSWVEVAVRVAVPEEAGVKTPELLTLPIPEGLTDQLTALLKLPVPLTVGVQEEVWVVRIEPGEQDTATVVMAGDTVTVTVAEPDLVGSWVEVAVRVAVPEEAGVKTPELLTLPIPEGLTDQLTALLKLPAPLTVGVQEEVWVVRIEPGEQDTATVVMAGDTVTVTVAEPDLVGSWVEVAVRVAVPEEAGVKTPELLTLPIPEGLTDQLTALLKLPAPLTVGVQEEVWVVRIEPGEQDTATVVMAGDTVTVTVAEPDLVGSWVEVAVRVAVPEEAGVKTPELLTLPIPEGLTDQLTALLKLPAPLTVGVQEEVWVVRIEPGEQDTATVVMAGDTVTVTVAEPDLVGSWVEVAVRVAVPEEAGVKTPELLTLPIPEGLTDQLTALLKLPAPLTVGVQEEVWVVRIEPGEQDTATVVMAGDTVTVTVAEPDLVGSWVEVAVRVAVPEEAGVKTPELLTLPIPEGLTDQLTALLKLPAPLTVGVQEEVWVVRIEPGEQDTATVVMAGDTVTVTVAEPDLVGSWVEVAVRVAVPEEAGVKTPELLTLPIPEGLTDQLTALLKLPVPLTVGVQEEVWVVRIEPGEQDTATVVMAGDTVTVTVAEPDLVGSWVEVAVRVAVPEEAGVKTPELLTLPIPEGLTDQLTALLKLPAPLTVGVQEEVWVVRIEPGEQDTATVVMAGDTVTVTVAEPDLVGSWVEVAVRVAVPEEAGVKTPELLTLPIPEGLTDQLTALLKLPAPLTVGVQEEVWVVRIEPGEQDTATVVMAGDTVTVTVAEPDLVGSWVEVAVRVAVPEEAGVKTPELLTLPIPEGLTDQLTALLKLPAPLTVGVQEEVWVVRIEPGEQDTATVVMAGDTVTVTVAEPDLVGSWVEVAVRVAVPEEAGVKTPELLTLPIPEGLTDQLTALLKLPAPLTVGVQEEVWVVRIEPGEQDTATVVMAGDTVTVTVAEPDLVGSWVEVAVRVAVPEEAGVKTPELLTLPIPEGLTDQLTALL
jgi:hypothetical protein